MAYLGRKTSRSIPSSLLFAAVLLCSQVYAQKALTPEELEAHIEKQKAELEAAIVNRDNIKQELELKRKALEVQAARQAELEESMKELCKEQEEVKPGSMENCMAAITPK